MAGVMRPANSWATGPVMSTWPSLSRQEMARSPPGPSDTFRCCVGVVLRQVFNTQLYALLAKLYSGTETRRAFTVFQLYQNVGSAVGYYIGVRR
jgi:hypothetical protein